MSSEIKTEPVEDLNGSAIAMEMLMNMQNVVMVKREADFDAMDDSHSDGSNGENGEPTGTPHLKKITVTKWKGRLVPINEHTDKLCIIYDSPISDRTYKFILHRKNNQKADNYACARCKSRKKYIRVLVSGEYFLEDPEALEHICYLTGRQLEREKEKLQEKAGRAMVEAAARTPKTGTKRYRPSRTAVLTVPTTPNSSNMALMSDVTDDGAALLQLLRNSGVMTGLNQSISPVESTSTDIANISTSNIMENLMKKCFEAEEAKVGSRASQEKQSTQPEPKEIKLESRPPVLQVMPVISNNESNTQQTTTPSTSVPSSLSSLFDISCQSTASVSTPNKVDPSSSEIFFMGLRRALDGIPDSARPKAENDIMQYVYQSLYAKYVRNS